MRGAAPLPLDAPGSFTGAGSFEICAEEFRETEGWPD
jgi:hypothetical protein